MVSQRRIEEAIALHRAGHLLEAAQKYEALRVLNPDDPDIMHLQGVLAGQLGHYGPSLELIGRAVAARPRSPDFRNSLAVTLERLGRIADAAAAFNEQGNLLLAERVWPGALAAFEHALRLEPASPFFQCNRGVALLKLGRYEEAVATLSAIPDEGRLSYVSLNLGNALTGLARTTEAIAAYDRALALEPDLVEARWARGQALLLAGSLSEGWQEYEWRKRWAGFDNPYRQLREWQGESPQQLKGRLLVVCEQGLGDAIQFARYVPMLARQGYDIVLEMRDQLYPLFRDGFQRFGVEIVARAAMASRQPGEFAAHVPLLSLPYHFTTTIDTIPDHTPYLTVPTERIKAFAATLPETQGPRIGIVRAGQSLHGSDFARSIPAEALGPLLAVDAEFHSLQIVPFDAPGVPTPSVLETGLAFKDFQDTAAAIMNMDMVISCDTSVAHLAGALGRPVWIMLPAAPDWRWGLQGNRTPWYPAARLFRQTTRGDWTSVISDIAIEASRTKKNG